MGESGVGQYRDRLSRGGKCQEPLITFSLEQNGWAQLLQTGLQRGLEGGGGGGGEGLLADKADEALTFYVHSMVIDSTTLVLAINLPL